MIYGKFIRPRAFSKEGTYVRDPQNLVNDSDMSGYGGMEHTSGVDLESVWLTRNNEKDVWVAFDFGSVVRLGYMCIWNLNQTDGFGSGLKKVKIFYSYDNENYTEFKGKGYPYIFEQATGTDNLKATNLADGENSPLNFEGLSARYIKIVPDVESGEGCHGRFIEGQLRFGLSQVRFFTYRENPKMGGYVYARGVRPELDVLTSDFGIENKLQNTNIDTMYLSEANPKDLDMVFDLNMCTFIKGLDIYNFNEPKMLQGGIKKFLLQSSLDKFNWDVVGEFELSKAEGKDSDVTRLTNGELLRFDPIYTRYIKITLLGGAGIGTHGTVNGFEFRYGVSKVRFLSADTGYFVEVARDWTSVLSNFKGWTGSDGIFITNLEGNERKPVGSERKTVKNLISFGDTFIGEVNPVTNSRKRADMVNNSFCYMEGLDPSKAKMDFVWGKNGSKEITNLIYSDKEYTYWLQDCVITGNKFYSFTDNIITDLDNEELMEGFRFHLTGVDMVIFDVKDGELDLESHRTIETPLYAKDNMMFGCGIFANTEEAGMENPDGYLYIYGIKEMGYGERHLLVARTLPENIINFDEYTFFDGKDWTKDMLKAAPIAPDLAPEMSVMPVDFGKYKGKYIYIYSVRGVSDNIVARIGDTPYGPFETIIPLFNMSETEDLDTTGLKKVYQYNAKAHYNVAENDEILITYNVNCMDYESHLFSGNLYRPRFIRYKEF